MGNITLEYTRVRVVLEEIRGVYGSINPTYNWCPGGGGRAQLFKCHPNETLPSCVEYFFGRQKVGVFNELDVIDMIARCCPAVKNWFHQLVDLP